MKEMHSIYIFCNCWGIYQLLLIKKIYQFVYLYFADQLFYLILNTNKKGYIIFPEKEEIVGSVSLLFFLVSPLYNCL